MVRKQNGQGVKHEPQIGLHRHRNPKNRKNRPRRQRDKLTKRDRTFEDASRQEINDYIDRLQEIRDQEHDITWAQEGAADQKKFGFSSRTGEIQPLRGISHDDIGYKYLTRNMPRDGKETIRQSLHTHGKQ